MVLTALFATFAGPMPKRHARKRRRHNSSANKSWLALLSNVRRRLILSDFA
jgi:hypothetical protein